MDKELSFSELIRQQKEVAKAEADRLRREAMIAESELRRRDAEWKAERERSRAAREESSRTWTERFRQDGAEAVKLLGEAGVRANVLRRSGRDPYSLFLSPLYKPAGWLLGHEVSFHTSTSLQRSWYVNEEYEHTEKYHRYDYMYLGIDGHRYYYSKSDSSESSKPQDELRFEKDDIPKLAECTNEKSYLQAKEELAAFVVKATL